jgi:uncharacterized protein (DUF924 family)
VAEALARRILAHWFGTPKLADPVEFREAWFKRDDAFDQDIRASFSNDVESALRGELDGMSEGAQGALALLLLLDQFTRNLFRGTPKAFAGDARARKIAKAALARGFDAAMSPNHRIFLYLPFEHSEDIADQARSVTLFATLNDPRAYDYAVRHKDVVARFGRFPHRNAALGRESTLEEIEFLKTPGSSF